MVVKRKNTFIRQVKDITLSGALTAGLLATAALPLGCGPDRNQTETVYTKGVQTFIREVDWGEFKITTKKWSGKANRRPL
jgi:hypothetical protein